MNDNSSCGCALLAGGMGIRMGGMNKAKLEYDRLFTNINNMDDYGSLQTDMRR
ncbi:MAG: hypothetical protein IJJ03_08875 [Mogibacterium sp.]|nr:hypothetical protein [Mogibacterium sp.]